MTYNFKKELIEKVQSYKGAVMYNIEVNDKLETLRKVLKEIFPNDRIIAKGQSLYYFAGKSKNFWESDFNLPDGMEAIPLSQFLEDEKPDYIEKEKKVIQRLKDKGFPLDDVKEEGARQVNPHSPTDWIHNIRVFSPVPVEVALKEVEPLNDFDSRNLLPCPFCGGKPEWINNFHPSGIRALQCHECQFTISQDRKDKTVSFWNRRTPPISQEVDKGIPFPSPYKGELNTKRIAAYKRICEEYDYDESAIGAIFTAGIHFYITHLEYLQSLNPLT